MSRTLAGLPVGQHVLVDELGEQPLDAIEHHTRLVPQPPPDTSGLAPHDVVIAISAARISGRTRDPRRNYFGYAPAYALSNINDDHARPGRQDYTVFGNVLRLKLAV